MKKILCLIIAFACFSSQAQTLRMLNVYKHNGSIDTTLLSVLDSATIGNNLADLILHLNTGSKKTIALAQIDSMFCQYKDGPVYSITQPTGGQVFHVGDSVTVTWNFNPAPAGDKAYFMMSTHGGKTGTFKYLTNTVCYMMWKSSSYAGTSCSNGINYVSWPYTITNGKYVGTWKFKIQNPMTMPDATTEQFNPISDSVVIQLHDYVNTELSNSAMFKIQQ